MIDEDDSVLSTPTAPRELRQKLARGEITEEEFERRRQAIKNGAARARISIECDQHSDMPISAPPDSPSVALSRQFSELMDPEVKNLLSKVKLGKEKEVKDILSKNPAILKNCTDFQGNTLLHIAALNGHKRIVKEVLRNADRFDPWAVNKKGFSAVDLARDFNYPELADYIREKLPGISELKPAALGTEGAEVMKQDQLDDVSEALARVQAEREQLEREQELRMQELLLETDRNRSAKERTEQAAKAAREAAEATQRHEKELQEKLASLEQRAKAEQECLERAFQEKMVALEEANKKEKEERERLAAEKAALESSQHRVAAALQSDAVIKALQASELSKKQAEVASKEDQLAKERAAKNEAVAELCLLKAQLAQAKREQELAVQEAQQKQEQMLADKAAAAEEANKLQLLLPENASTERDRLLLEFEERRKDLEAQQKQEQDRQERLLQELLEIKRKKREAKAQLGKKELDAEKA